MMTFTIARRNLTHDKARLAVTLTGVLFAVTLVTIQLGIFAGFTSTTSGVIDHSRAHVWVGSRGVRNFDIAVPMTERKLYQALSVPGVDSAEKVVVHFANWRKPLGGEESVEIIGFDPRTQGLGPWNLVGDPAWTMAALEAPDTVLADVLYLGKLGVRGVGESVEINGRRARVVGLTKGVRSFTTSPYIFTHFKNAQNYSRLQEDQTTYILATAQDGVTPEELKSRLLARVPDVDVFTTAEFSKKTQDYWMFNTGAGMSLIMSAALGLVVGVVIVAQTLYATTMDHLSEFATLRAMGAPSRYIYEVIGFQAVISAVAGYLLGMSVCLVVVWSARDSGMAILLPWRLAGGMFFLTLGMCLTASFVSIHRVTRIDPTMVFK